MQVTVSFDSDTCGAELLIDLANILSKEIDSPCVGYRSQRPLRIQQFKAICNVLASRDIELSDYVRCPELSV